MIPSGTRSIVRGLVGFALGAVLATSGGVGTVLGAKPTPAITNTSCTTTLYEGAPDTYTSVAWEGLRPKRVVFTWNDTYSYYQTVSVVRPRGSSLSVPTPRGGTQDVLNGTVTIYGPNDVELQAVFDCHRG